MFRRFSLRAAFVTTPRLIAMACAIAIGLTLTAGAAIVAAQRGEPGEPPSAEAYQGCVNNHTGVLRIVTEGQSCAEHEMPIQISGSAGDAALLERIEDLEAENEMLQQENIDQQTEISALDARLTELETNPVQLPACLTTEAVANQEIDDVVFDGCNVHVRNGEGITNTANGLGNLVIGYNEGDGDTRSGSHNLIVGSYHSYSSYGGLIAGLDNSTTEPFAGVSGGFRNTASGIASSVSGGRNNTANGHYSSASGGRHNTANGENSSLSGGYLNTAYGNYSSVSGGNSNVTYGNYSSVSGGNQNSTTGLDSSVSGGASNVAQGHGSSISGGFENVANGYISSISGGAENTIGEFADHGSISGGYDNTASADYSSVGGNTGLDADEIYEFLP